MNLRVKSVSLLPFSLCIKPQLCNEQQKKFHFAALDRYFSFERAPLPNNGSDSTMPGDMDASLK